jgi:tetratricopeptide (TPR) repeat protein/CheY-like chemotaxis protein
VVQWAGVTLAGSSRPAAGACGATMACKVVRLISLHASRWQAAALAALVFCACAAAQTPTATSAAESADRAPVSAEQTLKRVRELRASGQFAATLEPLERYLALDPRNTVIRLEYARALAVLRRFPEAAREYRRVLETEPQNASAMVGMAKVAAWQGQNQLALETYDRVLAQRPNYYDAVVGKAFLLLWMGRQVEARALFLEAQRQHPNDREVREALASSGAPGDESAEPATPAESAPGAVKATVPESKPPPPGEAAGPTPKETRDSTSPPAASIAPQAAASPPTAGLFPATSVPLNTGDRPALLAREEPPALQHPQESTASRVRGARKEAAATAAAVQEKPRPGPSASPLPARAPTPIPAQLAMLGMVATVAGAIAYRTLRVRRRPVSLAARHVLELPPSSLVSPPRPASAGKAGALAGRVVVVHPHEAVRDFAHRALAGAGAEVVALERGDDAVAGLEKRPCDAIVVSDHLPLGWSGREIYRWMERNQPGAERSFVLVITGEPDPEMQAFLDESRPLSLVAPFGVSDLLAMTRLAMERSRAQA